MMYKMLCPAGLWEKDYSEGRTLGILKTGDMVELLHLTPHTANAYVEVCLQGKPVRGYVMREALDLLPQQVPAAQNVFPSPFLRIANAVARYGTVKVVARVASVYHVRGLHGYDSSAVRSYADVGNVFSVSKVDVPAEMVYNAEKCRWHKGDDLELFDERFGRTLGSGEAYYVDTDSIQDEKTVVSGQFQAPAVGTVRLKAGDEISIHRMAGLKENLAVRAGTEVSESEWKRLFTRNSELSDKLGSLQTEHNQLLRDYALLQRENDTLKRKLGKVGSR